MFTLLFKLMNKQQTKESPLNAGLFVCGLASRQPKTFTIGNNYLVAEADNKAISAFLMRLDAFLNHDVIFASPLSNYHAGAAARLASAHAVFGEIAVATALALPKVARHYANSAVARQAILDLPGVGISELF